MQKNESHPIGQQRRSHTTSGLELRQADLLRAAVPRPEIGDLPAREQWPARPAAYRSAAPGGGDRRAGEQPAGIRREPQRPAPSVGSPLAAGHELCAPRAAVDPAQRDQRQPAVHGLDADPAARTGPVHPQSWHATPLERDLFHADCAAATTTTQRADHFCLGA